MKLTNENIVWDFETYQTILWFQRISLDMKINILRIVLNMKM